MRKLVKNFWPRIWRWTFHECFLGTYSDVFLSFVFHKIASHLISIGIDMIGKPLYYAQPDRIRAKHKRIVLWERCVNSSNKAIAYWLIISRMFKGNIFKIRKSFWCNTSTSFQDYLTHNTFFKSFLRQFNIMYFECHLLLWWRCVRDSKNLRKLFIFHTNDFLLLLAPFLHSFLKSWKYK